MSDEEYVTQKLFDERFNALQEWLDLKFKTVEGLLHEGQKAREELQELKIKMTRYNGYREQNTKSAREINKLRERLIKLERWTWLLSGILGLLSPIVIWFIIYMIENYLI